MQCPFRSDVAPYLRGERCVEISRSIASGAEFPCHKTLGDDGDGELVATPDSQMRVAERLGFYDPAALDMDAPVVGSLSKFVEHHADPDESDE